MRDLSSIVENAESLGIDAALHSLGNEAKAMGVKLRLTFDDRIIDLHHIERSPDTPKGSGAVVMEALCGIADRTGLRINLYAYGAFDALADYYGRFGFEVDPEGDDEAMMRRLAAPRRQHSSEAKDETASPSPR